MKHFKETVIEEVQTEDLDMEYPWYENSEQEEPNDVDTAEDIWSETLSMDIRKAIEILQKLEEKGANRVYLYAHSDHHSYIFTGINLEEIKEDAEKPVE
jgi:hypothetical protein